VAPAVVFVALTDSEVRARFERIVSHLDHWGDVVAADNGRARGRRLLEFSVVAPGGGLAAEAKELFREYYELTRSGDWEMVKYTYEYLDVGRGARLAFHVHNLGGRKRVAHAHCDDAFEIPDDERPPHLRAVEYELREAHAVFMRHWAASEPPDCESMLPLEVDRT
jgi:hypothetical protein